jgi:hypothetical protein
MKQKFLLFMLFFLNARLIFPQFLFSTAADSLMDKKQYALPDSAIVNKYNPQKELWVPVLESVGLNMALSGFNFLMGSEFAKIGLSTIGHNFERGWSTDADGFITNMLGHPFNGSIYYNFARSSGYNYWVSFGISAIGSWQWEFFMENEPPAINDWIMTSYGGSMIGEIFYRLSNLIIDESTVGSERFWRELGAGIFNPGRLFNRLISGRTSRIVNENIYKKDRIFGEIAFGANNVAEGTDFANGEKNPMFTLDAVYGNNFPSTKNKPFDFFNIHLAINFSKQPIVGQFRLSNLFMGKSIKLKNNGRFSWGLYGHYDYIENNVYQIGQAGAGFGIGYRTPLKRKISFVSLLHTGVIFMGGANSDYAPNYDVIFLDSARAYNMGPGALIKSESIFRFPFGSLSVGYSFWWIHTWDGAPGDEFIGMFYPKLRFHVYDKFFLGFEYLLYHRFGKYENLEDRSYQNNEQRIFVGYAF